MLILGIKFVIMEKIVVLSKGLFVLNVYDFDNTIYDGESIFDFFLFCLKKQPSLVRYIPLMVNTLAQYKLCRITAEELTEKAEKYMGRFFSGFEDTQGLIKEFWDKNIGKIKPFYLQNHREDDVIITASWDALIAEACKRLGIHEYIASEIDKETFRIKFLCYRDNKVHAFREKYRGKKVDSFYTDSKNDLPMMKIAERAYIVKGGKVKKYDFS